MTKDILADYNESNDFEVDARIGIKETLESGLVLFGDSVSQYVNSVGRKILKANNLQGEIKFYVVRSPIINAYSFDQGSIFVTIGTIARCKNEAELAYILCHELVHYIQKHSYEAYGLRNKIDQTADKQVKEKILEYFKYSRTNEFVADSVGVDLYLKCGYDTSHLQNAITQLSPQAEWVKGYSWSPDYLEDKYLQFPTVYGLVNSMHQKKYHNFFDETATEEEYNELIQSDSANILEQDYKTHPDWEKRLIRLKTVLANYSESEIDKYQNESVYIDKNQFKQINKLCRWELLYYFMIQGDYYRAHYYSLEMEYLYGYSKTLELFRVVSLNNIYYSYFSEGESKTYLTPIFEIEDREGANIFHLLRFCNLLSEKEWAVILVRENYKLQSLFPTSKFVTTYWINSLSNLKQVTDNGYSKYFDIPADSTKDLSNESLTKNNIRQIREDYLLGSLHLITANNGRDNFDTLYARTKEGLINEDAYLQVLSKTYDKKENVRPKRSKPNKRQLDTISFVGVNVNKFKYRTKVYEPNRRKNDSYEEVFTKHLVKSSEKLKLELKGAKLKDPQLSSAKSWNEQYVLKSWLTERSRHESSGIIPIMSIVLSDSTQSSKEGLVMICASAIFSKGPEVPSSWLPVKPFVSLFTGWGQIGDKGPRVYLFTILADTENNEVLVMQIDRFNTNIKEDLIRAQMYRLIYEIKSQIRIHDK